VEVAVTFLVVVLARKGSKRLKDKHFQGVTGSSEWPVRVSDYPLKAASRAHFSLPGSALVVSSDDRRFSTFGVGIFRRRPARLCTAKASVHTALVDALKFTERQTKLYFDAVISLQGNVVTATPEIVMTAAGMLSGDPGATAVMTVQSAGVPPEWMFTFGKRYLQRQSADKAFRMQDLPQRYVPTGTCCVVRREVLLGCRSDAAFEWLGDRIFPLVEKGPVIEVHDQGDLDMARAWFNRPAQRESGG
jgi:CMP-N-acetylneuraminic acid synthetase